MSEYGLPNFSTELSGNVALVIGATSGLGRRFARVITDAGGDVAIAGRRAEKLKELQEETKPVADVCRSLRMSRTRTTSFPQSIKPSRVWAL